MGVPGNAFEALCGLAAEGRWCWRLYCTTCGSAKLRNGLLLIARGIHPGSAEWGEAMAESLERCDFRGLSEEVGASERLYDSLVGADPVMIVRRGPLPDALGYLGQALAHTTALEARHGRLSVAWGGGLRAVVRPGSEADGLLQFVGDGQGGRLTWRDLAVVDRDLVRPATGPRDRRSE